MVVMTLPWAVSFLQTATQAKHHWMRADFFSGADGAAVPSAAYHAGVALRARSDERFELIFRLCPVPLALTAEKGMIAEANPALGRLFGLAPEELAGRRLLDFTHPDDRESSLAAAGEVLDGGESAAVMEKRYVTPDGRTLHARVTMLVFDDPDGESRKLTQIVDLTDQRAREDALEQLTMQDPLTGVANRRELHRRLEPIVGGGGSGPGDAAAAVAAAGRAAEHGDAAWAVVFVDLDDFKDINDAYGHGVGDEVLTAVAGRLSAGTREPDLVARLGGDEFVVLLAVPSAGDLDAAVERIRRELERPLRVAGHTITVAASIGVARPRPDDSPQDVLNRADRAMYEDKRG
jgi:diguanylate cyclase (GGDEF)-like protein/PAS domain S-box-containing protein